MKRCALKKAGKPTEDHAAAIERLSRLLVETGHVKWKDRIDTAVAGGSTGTEILFVVLSTLREMLKSDFKKDKQIRSASKELIKKVNRTLKKI